MSHEIFVESPTRVDFAGGTLDCWPLYNFVGGAITTNLSIDISTSVTLKVRGDQNIHVHLTDLDFVKSYKNIQELFVDESDSLALLKSHLSHWKPEWGFEVHCASRSPVGAGLGGSSSLSVSLIKAFAQAFDTSLSERDMVQLASNIEARLLNTPTGTQDYYPAITGGLHILQYSYSGVEHTILKEGLEELSDRFFLVYTGKPHHSGLNNWNVIQRAVERDPETMNQLRNLKDVAEQVARTCEAKDWERLSGLFQKELEYRIALAPAFDSPEIQKVHKVAKSAGADAVKICGAGGGGCVMVWGQPDKRKALMSAVTEEGFQVLPCKPVMEQI